MPSVIPGFECDIFISYRHNDNLDGWVTDFVQNLEKELKGTLKDPITIYLDTNPKDGLLETHNVDKSLEGKLKSLIFIPIISQTYCDPKSFAWKHEFCAFNKVTKEDEFGRDIKLINGNVASRILSIKIHDLDAEDESIIENEIGGVLRAIEFIFTSPGVGRPLTPSDKREENQNKNFYRDQINKVARAVKELIVGIQHSKDLPKEVSNRGKIIDKPKMRKFSWAAIIIILLGLVGFGYYYSGWFGNRIAPKVDRSIAVLPFEDMSPNHDQVHIGNGMMDEILNHLFKIEDLKVISRTSSMKFKGAKLTAKEIAGQLGVENILEGSVQMADNRIKITVQLIDAATDNHLWSETYEREFKDIFAIQTDIATAVARELRTKLNSETKGELASIPTKSKLAYEFYLKGRDYESKYENPNAILMYSRAIQEDSMFALAYARRAHAHLLRFWVKKLGWEGHKELARNDIDVVMKIDPDLPELKLALAFWHYYGFRDYEKALTLLKELQITTPNDPDLHRILFALYRRQGRWKESILESEKALSLDPLNTSIINEFCSTYKLLHQYNDQLTTAKRGHFLIPEFKGFKWQILSAEINLRYNVATAIKASGLTVEESRGFRDYYNKNYSDVMATIRKEGIRVISGEYDFKPITLTYAAIYFLKGDRLMTKVYADSAISFLLKKLPDMDNDDRIYSSLGIAYAIAGQEKLAIEYGKKAIDLLPVSLDVWNGTFPEEKMANIYVYLAKYDLALKKMEPLLSKPSEFGIGWLLTDPLYEPLHNLPRFKELVEKYR